MSSSPCLVRLIFLGPIVTLPRPIWTLISNKYYLLLQNICLFLPNIYIYIWNTYDIVLLFPLSYMKHEHKSIKMTEQTLHVYFRYRMKPIPLA